MSATEIILVIAIAVIFFILYVGYDGYKNTDKWWG